MLTHGKQALQNGIKLFHEFFKSVAVWHATLLVRSNWGVWQCGCHTNFSCGNVAVWQKQ